MLIHTKTNMHAALEPTVKEIHKMMKGIEKVDKKGNFELYQVKDNSKEDCRAQTQTTLV